MKRSATVALLALFAIAVICLVLFNRSKEPEETLPEAADLPALGESVTIAESNPPPARTAAPSNSSTQAVVPAGQTLVATPGEEGESLVETNAVAETSDPGGEPEDPALMRAPVYRPLTPTPRSAPPTPATTSKVPESARDTSDP